MYHFHQHIPRSFLLQKVISDAFYNYLIHFFILCLAFNLEKLNVGENDNK
jgi:hypothetical protein